jgi:hypothetical protein
VLLRLQGPLDNENEHKAVTVGRAMWELPRLCAMVSTCALMSFAPLELAGPQAL